MLEVSSHKYDDRMAKVKIVVVPHVTGAAVFPVPLASVPALF
jgi:hypothetical protein